MVLGLSQADGDFRLPDARPDAILLISGGSGITPVMSMLRTLCAEGHAGPIAFLHYAPDPERAIYREELERLAAEHPNFALVRSYTRAPGAGELDGHFSPRPPRRRPTPTSRDAETFACGPPALLDAVRGDLGGERPRAAAPRRELRAPQPARPPASRGEGTVRFAGSDVEVENSGAPLLEQAEAAGAQPGVRLPDGHLPHLHLPQD